MDSEILDSLTELSSLVAEHEKWRVNRCLNLVASENTTSQRVRSLLASDFGHRYSSKDKFYMGGRFLDEVVSLGEETAKKVFNAKFVDIRPISGHICNLSVYSAFLSRGDIVASTSVRFGGYPGWTDDALGRIFGVKHAYFRINKDTLLPEVRRTSELLAYKRPKMVIYGSSFILFSTPIRKIEAGNSTIVYDGSHVLGLIAGGRFQQPLEEGCDVLIGSTHKSFFGPQGGIMLTDDEELFTHLSGAVHPGVVDNIHWNRAAALTYALLEMWAYGEEYADQVVRNSLRLARVLHEEGVSVRASDVGFTNSHQVILAGSPIGKGGNTARKLEVANIITDSGVRLGTAEVTRRGMKEEEMEEIGDLIARLLVKREDPRSVKSKVEKLASEFDSIHYTFT